MRYKVNGGFSRPTPPADWGTRGRMGEPVGHGGRELPQAQYKKGDRVLHSKWGVGTVKAYRPTYGWEPPTYYVKFDAEGSPYWEDYTYALEELVPVRGNPPSSKIKARHAALLDAGRFEDAAKLWKRSRAAQGKNPSKHMNLRFGSSKEAWAALHVLDEAGVSAGYPSLTPNRAGFYTVQIRRAQADAARSALTSQGLILKNPSHHSATRAKHAALLAAGDFEGAARVWKRSMAARKKNPKSKSVPAYLDSFAGLVPVKIVAAAPDGSSATYEVTGTRGAYKVGDRDVAARRSLIARKAVHTRGGRYRIYPHESPIDIFLKS